MSGYGKTDIGKTRTINEDSILVLNEKIGPISNLFIVADGMGGHSAGDVASNLAIEKAREFIENADDSYTPDMLLLEATKNANANVYIKAGMAQDLTGMGTTFLAMTVLEDTAYIANVGDSRLYIIDLAGKTINQVTIDHSYVMELVKQGKISAGEAEKHPNRNIITRAVGTGIELKIDLFKKVIYDEQIILMCSDGLTNMLTDKEILNICLQHSEIAEKTEKLITAANQKGGIDNVSVIIFSKGKEV